MSFVRVVENGSFSSAAQTLGMSASGVSKAVARLEARLGVRLLYRTTRSVSLTEEGSIYFDHCRKVLNELEMAEALVARKQQAPRGRLKIQLSPAFGRKIILPLLGTFLSRHPEVTIDVALDSRHIDLAESGIDVVMRFGEPPDSRLVARRLCRVNYVLCAAPAYLARHGTPQSLDALTEHRRLNYLRPQDGRYRNWTFFNDDRKVTTSAPGFLNVNDFQALLDSAVAGEGITYLPDFMIAEALASGQLRIVMPDHAHEAPRVCVAYLPNRTLAPRVRLFLDFLSEVIPAEPVWYKSVQKVIDAAAGAQKASA